MDLPVQPLLLNLPAHNGPGAGFLGIKPGETFTAQVMGRTAQGLTLLAFGGRQVPVNLANPPPAGTLLQLQVQQSPQGLRLVLLGTVPGTGGQAGQPPPVPPAPQLAMAARTGVTPTPSSTVPGASSSVSTAQTPSAATAPSASPASSAMAGTQQSVSPSAALLAQTTLTSLSGQNSIGGLFALISQVGDRLAGLPLPVREAVRRLGNAPLDLGKAPTALGLKTALEKSGLFLEASLARPNATPVQGDLKGLLLGLRSALSHWLGRAEAPPVQGRQPLPPMHGTAPRAEVLPTPMLPANPTPEALGNSLFAHTEAALARVRLLQMASLPDGPGHPASQGPTRHGEWQMELPFVFGAEMGTVHLQITRDGGHGSQDPDGEAPFQVRFALTTAALGEVGADVRLAGKRLAATLWADRPEVAQALQAGLSELRDTLFTAGLDLGTVHVRRPHREEKPEADTGHYVDLGT